MFYWITRILTQDLVTQATMSSRSICFFNPKTALLTLHEWHMKQRLLPTFIGSTFFRPDRSIWTGRLNTFLTLIAAGKAAVWRSSAQTFTQSLAAVACQCPQADPDCPPAAFGPGVCGACQKSCCRAHCLYCQVRALFLAGKWPIAQCSTVQCSCGRYCIVCMQAWWPSHLLISLLLLLLLLLQQLNCTALHCLTGHLPAASDYIL